MIATATREASAAAQMVAAGNAQISEIQSRIDELDELIAAGQSEIAALTQTLTQAREGRTQRLELARTEAIHLEDEYSQAASYATLAHKKPNEALAVKNASTAKKAMQDAKKKLERVEKEVEREAEADQAARAREIELLAQLGLHQSEKETREVEMAAVARGLSQAKKELGQEKYTAMMQAYQEKQHAMNLVALELVDLQVELADFYEWANQEMKDWPALQREIASLRPIDDNTSRMIESTIAYIEALIRDGGQIRMDVPLPWRLVDVLHVREQEIRGWPGALEERKRHLEQTLEAYRTYAATEQYGQTD